MDDQDPNLPLITTEGIIVLRNLIAHAYDSIDDTKLWAIDINHIPILKSEVEELFASK